MLDCQCKHQFSHSNAWTALTDVTPKELLWPLCTGWTLGWCRMLPMPVSVQSYENWPVVVGWCLMLCHTQYNHSQTWNEQLHGTASRVSVPSPFQVSDHSDEVENLLPLCLQHTDVFLKSEVPVPPQPKELRGLPLAEVCFQSSQLGSLSPRPGCSEMYDFAFVGCKPETIPWRPFLYGIHCLLYMSLYGVQRASLKTDCQVIDKECFEDVLGNTRGQLINLQSKTCHSQDTASWNTFPWVEFVRVLSQFWLGFAGRWDILTQKQAVCLLGQSCEDLGWYHIAMLSHMLSPSQGTDQMPAALGQMRPGDIFQNSPGGQWCYDASWSHTGFCLISQIFQDTRWSEYWSCVLGPCISSWSVQ